METVIQQKIESALAARIPGDWFVGAPTVEVDDDEVVVTGELAAPTTPTEFRERTREERIALASELEVAYRRKVTWAVRHDGVVTTFTSLRLPVMTRLGFAERTVLDTLVDGGVARSRSDALAWCVRLVARHQGEWLAELREALVGVEQVRDGGPVLA